MLSSVLVIFTVVERKRLENPLIVVSRMLVNVIILPQEVQQEVKQELQEEQQVLQEEQQVLQEERQVLQEVRQVLQEGQQLW